MAVGSSGASVRLPIELEIQNMQQIANTLRQFAKSNILSNSLGGKQIEQELNGILRKLSQIEIKAKGAFKSDSSLGSLETQLRGIEASMGHVQGLFGQLSFKDLQLPPEIQSQFAELGKRISEIQDKIANLPVEAMGKLKLDSALNFDLSKIFTPDKAGNLLEGTFDKLQAEVTQRTSALENQLRMAGENLKKAKEDLVAAVSSGGEGDYKMLQALKGLQAGFSDPKKAPEWMKQHWQLSDDGKTFRTFVSGNHSTEFYNALQAQYSLTDAQKKELEERMRAQKMALNKTMGEVLRESVMGDGKAFLGKDRGIAQTLAAQYEEASKAANKAAKDQQEAQEKLARAQHAVGIIQTAGQGMQTSMAPLRQELDGVVNSVTNLEQATLRSVKGNQVLQQSFQGMGGALKQVNGAIDQGRQQLASTDAQYRKMDGITSYIGRYFSAYAIIHKAVSAIKNAINEIKAIDKVITNIAVVTNMSQEQLWGKIGEYTSIAQQYGVATKDVYTVSQIFYQQGLQTAQVMSLTTETLKMAKIAGMEYKDAANAMTVAVRAFKIEMSEAQSVTDTYSALAAKFAVSSAEIANAMEKTASSAASVGMSLQSTSAFMSVMIQTTRESAQNIGSAMKSIISRYGEMKASPDKLLNIDGEEAAFNKVDTALASVGISIKDASGQFRDFDDVIMELAAKWGSLDNNTQRYIATIMAGNRQQSRFIALVSNYDELSRAMTVANNAENASVVQVAKTMDSIETKTQQLHNAWSQLYLDLHLEDAFKGVLDSLTQILTTVGDLGLAMGGLPTLMTVIGGGKALAKLPQALKEKGITGSIETWAQKKTAEHHHAEAYVTSKDQKETISIKKLEKQYTRAQKRGDITTIKDLEERYADYFAKKNNKNLETVKQEQTPEQAMTGVLEGGFSDVVAGGHADADAIVAAIDQASNNESSEQSSSEQDSTPEQEQISQPEQIPQQEQTSDTDESNTTKKYPITAPKELTDDEKEADSFISQLTRNEQVAVQQWDEAIQQRSQAIKDLNEAQALGLDESDIEAARSKYMAAHKRVQDIEIGLSDEILTQLTNKGFADGILAASVSRALTEQTATKIQGQQQKGITEKQPYSEQPTFDSSFVDRYKSLTPEQQKLINDYASFTEELEAKKIQRSQMDGREYDPKERNLLDQEIASLQNSIQLAAKSLQDVVGSGEAATEQLNSLAEASRIVQTEKSEESEAEPDKAASTTKDQTPDSSQESEKPEQSSESQPKISYSDLSDQDKKTIQTYAQAREQKKIADSRLAFAKQDLESAKTNEERAAAQERVTKAEEAVASAAEAMNKAAESAQKLSSSFDELADQSIEAKDVEIEIPGAEEEESKDNTKGKTKIEDNRSTTDKLGDFFSSKGFQFAEAVAPIVGAAITAWGASQKPTSDDSVEWNKIATGVGNGLSMAAQGAELGSILGPWGTLIGSIGGFLIGGVGAIIDGLNVSAKERYEMAKEEAAKAKEESLKANAKTVDLSSRIEEINSLRKTMYNSTEDMQKYKEAMNNMAADYPQLVESYDSAGNAIINLNSAEETLLATRLEAARAATNSAAAELKAGKLRVDQYKGAVTAVETSSKYSNVVETGSAADIYYNDRLNLYKKLFSQYGNTPTEGEDWIANIIGTQNAKEFRQVINKSDASLEDYEHYLSIYSSNGSLIQQALNKSNNLSDAEKQAAEYTMRSNSGDYEWASNYSLNLSELLTQLNNSLKDSSDLNIKAVNGAHSDRGYIAGLLGYSEEQVKEIETNGGWNSYKYLELAINKLKELEVRDERTIALLEKQLYNARGNEAFLSSIDLSGYNNSKKLALSQMTFGGSLVSNLASINAQQDAKDLQQLYLTTEGEAQAKQYMTTAAETITNWLGGFSAKKLDEVTAALGSVDQYSLQGLYRELGITDFDTDLAKAIAEHYNTNIKDARQRISNILEDENGKFDVNKDFQELENLSTEMQRVRRGDSYKRITDIERLYEDIQSSIPIYSDFFADQLIAINDLAKDGYTELARNRLVVLEQLARQIQGLSEEQQRGLFGIISNINFSDFESLTKAKEDLEAYAKTNGMTDAQLAPILSQLDIAINNLVFNVNTLAQSLVDNISGAAKNINTILTTNKSGLDFSQALDEYSKMYAKDSTIGKFDAVFQYDAALKKFVYTDIGLNKAISQTNETLEENAKQLEKTAKQTNVLNSLLEENFNQDKLFDKDGKIDTTKIKSQTEEAIKSLKQSEKWVEGKGLLIDEDTYLSEGSLRAEYQSLLTEYANSNSTDTFEEWLKAKAAESNTQMEWALQIHQEYQENIASQYFAAIDWGALATGVDPGGVNKLYKTKLIEELKKKGYDNLTNESSLEEIVDAYAKAYGLDSQEVERAVKQNILQSKSQSITTAINELLKGPGTIVSETTRELLKQAGEIKAISSTGQIIAEGDALIESMKAVYQAHRDAFLTLAERNASYAEIIAAEAQEAIDTRTLLQSGGTGIDIKSFGTIAANKGFSLDTILANLDFYGLARDVFGNIIIKNFELFAEVFDLDINSPEYATYYDQYAKAMVDLQNQPVTLMQNATKEIKDLLSGSYAGQAFNVSQLEIAAKDMGIENLEATFNKYGVIVTNGVATLTNVAASNLQGLVTDIISQMEDANQAIPAELAALKDAIIATLDNIVTLIKNGISGNLSNEKSVQLQDWADQFNINLDFTPTAEGLKLSQQSAMELYYALQGVDHIRAQLVFNALSDSLQSANENYQSVSSIMAHIVDLENQIKIANGKGDKTRIQQYEQELKLAKEILAVRMTKEDSSYNFMSNKIPGAQQNQLNYYQNWATAAQKVNDAFDISKNSKNGQTGFIDYQDWYNIVNEINHIAGATGTKIEIAGVTLDGKLENAALLIQKGADALTTIDTGEVKVNLGAAGLNIKSAGQLLTKDVNTGIQKFTQAEAKMLDGYIQLLEVIVAMEGLDDVVGEDMTLDLPDIIFEPPVAPDGSVLDGLVKGYTIPYNKFRKKLLTYLDKDNKLFNKDLDDAMTNLQIFDPTANNGEGTYLSMKKILGMDSEEFEKLGVQAQNDYAAALNAFYQAYRRGDYDPEDPVGSLERILGDTKLNNVQFSLGDQTILYKSGVALVKSEKGDTWEVNGKKFKEPDAAVQYAKTSSIGALTGFENKANEKTGETTYTLNSDLGVTVSYDVDTGYTAKFTDNTVITAASQEALNFAVQAYLTSEGIQSGTNSESNDNNSFTYTINKKGTGNVTYQVDKTTGVVKDKYGHEIPYDPNNPDSLLHAVQELASATYGKETPETPEETPGETTTTTTTNTMEITDVTNVVLKGAATGETGEDGLPVYEPIPSISAKAKELKITEIENIKVEKSDSLTVTGLDTVWQTLEPQLTQDKELVANITKIINGTTGNPAVDATFRAALVTIMDNAAARGEFTVQDQAAIALISAIYGDESSNIDTTHLLSFIDMLLTNTGDENGQSLLTVAETATALINAIKGIDDPNMDTTNLTDFINTLFSSGTVSSDVLQGMQAATILINALNSGGLGDDFDYSNLRSFILNMFENGTIDKSVLSVAETASILITWLNAQDNIPSIIKIAIGNVIQGLVSGSIDPKYYEVAKTAAILLNHVSLKKDLTDAEKLQLQTDISSYLSALTSGDEGQIKATAEQLAFTIGTFNPKLAPGTDVYNALIKMLSTGQTSFSIDNKTITLSDILLELGVQWDSNQPTITGTKPDVAGAAKDELNVDENNTVQGPTITVNIPYTIQLTPEQAAAFDLMQDLKSNRLAGFTMRSFLVGQNYSGNVNLTSLAEGKNTNAQRMLDAFNAAQTKLKDGKILSPAEKELIEAMAHANGQGIYLDENTPLTAAATALLDKNKELEETKDQFIELAEALNTMQPDNATDLANALEKIANACNTLNGITWNTIIDGLQGMLNLDYGDGSNTETDKVAKLQFLKDLAATLTIDLGETESHIQDLIKDQNLERTINLKVDSDELAQLQSLFNFTSHIEVQEGGKTGEEGGQSGGENNQPKPPTSTPNTEGVGSILQSLVDAASTAADLIGASADAIKTKSAQVAASISTIGLSMLLVPGDPSKGSAVRELAAAMKEIPPNPKINIMLKVSLKQLADAKGTVDIEGGVPRGSYFSLTDSTYVSRAKGNAALAQGRRTLMGELGPELVVSNGSYFVVGQGGAEMVDLAPDAIVFNHIQTRNLLTNGKAGRGRPVTNERKAVSWAKGSLNGGPAMSSASATLAALKTLRAQLDALSKLSVQDLAGLGGTGGGGGGGSGNNKDSTFLQMLERWYDWLQQIAWIEKEITYQETLRAKLETDQVKNGYAYYQSQQESLDLLKEQIATQSSLNKERQEYFEVRRAEMNANQNPFTALYTFDEHGQIKYQTGALEWLSDLMGRNEDGSAKYTAEQQYNLLKDKYGKYMQYDSSGNKIFTEKKATAEEYQKAVQAFWDRIQSDQDEMQDLWNGIKDGQKGLLDLEKQQNEIINAQRQNQLDLEQEVLKAITDSRQKQIDEIKEEEEIIKKASDDYIDGLNDALSKERSMYENQKQDEELTKLQRQLSILQRTGGSASQIASLQQQIADKQQDIYFDKQQEQIDAIKDASDKQIEKMEQQIELMTKQLEYEKTNGLLWNQVYEILRNPEGEVLNFIMGNQQGWSEKSTLAKSKDMEDIKSMIQQFFAKRNDTEWATFKQETASGKYKKQWENSEIEKAAKAKFSDVLNKGGTIEEAKAAANQVFQEDINTGGWSTYSMTGGTAYKKYEKVWSADLVKKAQDAYATEYASSKDRSKAAAAADKVFDAEIDKGKAVLDLQITHGDGTTTNKTYKEEKAKTWTIADLAKANAKTGDDTNKLTVSQEKVTANPGERKSATATFGASTQQNKKYPRTLYKYGPNGQRTSITVNNDEEYIRAKKQGYQGFAKGGMVNYTGFAMLHGSQSNPEAVLNPEQTKILRDEILSNKPDSFFSLMQQLREEWKAQIQASSSTSTPAEQSAGTVIIEHAEVNLNAEIANDYDATRAGQRVYEELMAMARKAGAGNTIRR